MGKVQLNGGTPKYKIFGRVMHGRSVHSRFGKGAQNIEYMRRHIDPNAELVYTRGKHKYIYPLDKWMRKQVTPLAHSYPTSDHVQEA